MSEGKSREDFNNENIMTIAVEINSNAMEMKNKKVETDKIEIVLRKKYADFSKHFPSLFAMCARGELDENIIKNMLSMKNKVDQGVITQHHASESIGNMFLGKVVLNKK